MPRSWPRCNRKPPGQEPADEFERPTVNNPSPMAHDPRSASGLRVKNLHSGYGRGPDIVRDVSLHAPHERITALVGPNGSGKSTLLHTVLGLIRPRQGEILLDGAPLAKQISSRVGFCADDLPLPELLTGLEYVQTMTRLRSVQASEADMLEYFAALRMADAASDLIGSYSHGMKRKVQLIANVFHRPSLLVLDEPFRGLDPETAALLRRVLTETASRGRAILVSTHDLAAVESFCHRVVVLSRGEVVLDADIAALRAAAEGQHTFLEDAFLDATGLRADVEESAQRAATLIGDGL